MHPHLQVMRAVRRRSLPMVVDADGLWLVNQDPSLVAGKLHALYCFCVYCMCTVFWAEQASTHAKLFWLCTRSGRASFSAWYHTARLAPPLQATPTRC